MPATAEHNDALPPADAVHVAWSLVLAASEPSARRKKAIRFIKNYRPVPAMEDTHRATVFLIGSVAGLYLGNRQTADEDPDGVAELRQVLVGRIGGSSAVEDLPAQDQAEAVAFITELVGQLPADSEMDLLVWYYGWRAERAERGDGPGPHHTAALTCALLAVVDLGDLANDRPIMRDIVDQAVQQNFRLP
ncbi:hypothetical protein EF903_06940 [Streptomyces sp. WAC05292]|uniref:hypothetical protein n=1 Tax=Streptomyces sp. WAC05292 TaxID=2487418 RepID=UPI000F735867|nr:hypothetical protein [Streptomyces sp. WAC05292]RSS94268.1 hypothetical protein EF903_06940 [Streptomyces sp. WAC05292]